MCWAACDRLANAARTLGREDRQAFWQDRADTIRATIESRAARDGNSRLSATFGGDDIDASLLQLLDLRFLSPDDSRFRNTLDVVEKALRHPGDERARERSEEHTSELQSLMRHSYAVLCLKKKK